MADGDCDRNGGADLCSSHIRLPEIHFLVIFRVELYLNSTGVVVTTRLFRSLAPLLLIALFGVSSCGGGGSATKSHYDSYEDVTFADGERPHVIIETDFGNMDFELWPDVAYVHCQNFVYLATTGFYDSLTFHRIVPGFVIQGGDPNGNGTGGPGYTIPAEFSDKPHIEGTLSMARSSDPNSAGSQFFVCLGRLTSLDGKYSVFGQLKEGYDVLHTIEQVPAQRERPIDPVVITRVYVVWGS